MFTTKNISPRDVKYVELLQGGKVTCIDNKMQVTYPQVSSEDDDTAYAAAVQYMHEVGFNSLRRSCRSTEDFILDEVNYGDSFKLDPISGDELSLPEKEDIASFLQKGADLKEELNGHWYPEGTGDFFEHLSSSLKGGLMSFDFDRFGDICYRLLSDAVISYCEDYVAEEVDGFNLFCDYYSQEVVVNSIDEIAEAEDLYYESVIDSKIY